LEEGEKIYRQGQTAAEVILHRADATKDRMGLTIWKDAP
jgi:hypothetical protein